MDGDGSASIVTLGDLYREFSDMRREVTAAITRLAVVDNRFAAADVVHVDHEARLRVIERFRYTILGAAAAVGAASGIISAIITAHLH